MLHLPLKIVQRLDMPQAFAGDGTEGQRTEKVGQKDFRYVKELSFAERFKLPTVAPIIYGGFGVTGQSDNLLYGNDILILAKQFGVIVVHLPNNIFFFDVRNEIINIKQDAAFFLPILTYLQIKWECNLTKASRPKYRTLKQFFKSRLHILVLVK